MYNDVKNPGTRIPYHPPREPDCEKRLCADTLRGLFSGCADFQTRELRVGGRGAVAVCCCFLDGLVSGAEIAETLLRPLTDFSRFGGVKSEAEALSAVLAGQVYGAAARECRTADEAAQALLGGCCLLVFDGLGRAAAFETKTDRQRAISGPASERALKGARDSFTETLRVNTSLLRRRLRTPALRLRPVTLGRKSNTRAELVFVDGVADPALAERLETLLKDVETDGVLTTGEIESCLSDSSRSPFPTLLLTERPDRFCLNLLEGRVGLLVDGIPLGWLAPATLPQQLRVPDDVSKHFLAASAMTLLRHLALLTMLLLPALYAATATYHQEMLPFRLLLSIIESKQSVPFSTALELLGMLTAFELLQEAGLRLPKSVGETVSIIGALIVGQSAVEAKVVSPIAVIVVATSGIAGYTVPDQDLTLALRLCRFALVLAAIAAGIFGIAAASALLLWHLCSLDSYGVAYLAPLADGDTRDWLRALLQPPPWRDLCRDRRLRTPDRRRHK